MDRLHSMNVFVAVAEEGGFAAAARRLNISGPAVTRAVAGLEEHLGIKLLNRTTRYVRVTAAGQRYLDDARRILNEIDMADEAAAGVNAEPRGHLTVTAPVLFGRKYVLPGIIDYLERFPEVTVSSLFVDRVVNLLEEGLDVGVRIGNLPDSSMRALQLGSVKIVACAAPSYLTTRGEPEQPEELVKHTIIASNAGSHAIDWRFEVPGTNQTLRLTPRLQVTTNDAAIAAAIRGFGITRVLSYQVAEHLADGRLVRILEDFEPAPRPIHIVHREDRLGSARVRTFIDLLAERLREDPALGKL